MGVTEETRGQLDSVENRVEILLNTLLKNPTVRINDKESFKTKASKILKDGSEGIHVICDFDMTMSRYWVRNQQTDALERNSSSHNIPAKYSKIDPKYSVEAKKVSETFYAIEIHPNMTHEEKTPFMIQWWEEAHRLMIAQNLTEEDIKAMVKEARLELRPMLGDVLQACNTSKIPFLVFSAGVLNLIREVLVQSSMLLENMFIVSNAMDIDAEGRCVGFKDPLIHVFNKSEFQLESTSHYASIQKRRNVVLIGDSLGDLQMGEGVSHDLCLSIGFLNHDIKVLEPAYVEKFDIVIVGDANMSPVHDFILALNN
ncbi:pyrimidine 5'-nucleotidase-domain-containing protein [Spinellus fusiger]|nr:pyrimidine 5'-nucleotidase-domain-containing protein [Spinellus fusiger]